MRNKCFSVHCAWIFWFCLFLLFIFFAFCLCDVSCFVGQTQSSVYTIDVNGGMPANFTNPAYVSTEASAKNPSDGLPTYEEAIGVVKCAPIAPAQPTIAVVNEEERDDGDGGQLGNSRRHRRRRHHRHHSHNENSEPNAADSEPRRHRHRRGLRKHLLKMKRRQHTETE